MDRIHVNGNARTLQRALNRFPWGGDHIVPYILFLLIKVIIIITLPEISPDPVICPEYVHC